VCCSQQIRFGLQSPQEIINCGVFHVYERALYKVRRCQDATSSWNLISFQSECSTCCEERCEACGVMYCTEKSTNEPNRSKAQQGGRWWRVTSCFLEASAQTTATAIAAIADPYFAGVAAPAACCVADA
jgi:hypothetical protein